MPEERRWEIRIPSSDGGKEVIEVVPASKLKEQEERCEKLEEALRRVAKAKYAPDVTLSRFAAEQLAALAAKGDGDA